MNSRFKTKVAASVAGWLTLGFVLIAASGTAATSMTACGESGACTNLRQTTYANLEVWQACEPTSLDPNQCLIEPGNPRDCTGVLACVFAVNAKFRAQAELAVYSIGESSQGCYLCATPNCISGQIAVCEPVTRRCLAVTSVGTGGVIVSSPGDSGAGFPPFDAGPIFTPDAGAGD